MDHYWIALVISEAGKKHTYPFKRQGVPSMLINYIKVVGYSKNTLGLA